MTHGHLRRTVPAQTLLAFTIGTIAAAAGPGLGVAIASPGGVPQFAARAFASSSATGSPVQPSRMGPDAHGISEASAGWTGFLTVSSHEGEACLEQPALPYRRRVFAVALASADSPGPGPLLIWGELVEPLVVAAVSGASGSRALRPLDEGGVIGTAELSGSPDRLDGAWREQGNSQGCAFTQAQLALRPVEQQAVPGLRDDARALITLQRAVTVVEQASSREAERAQLQRIVGLAQAMPVGLRHVSRAASLLLQAGLHASMLGDRETATALIEAALSIYGSIPELPAEHLATARLHQAEAMRKAGRRAEAIAALREAWAVLERTGRAEGGAASLVLGKEGAWLLRDGAVDAAVERFSRAVAIDARRGAPAQESAIAWHNLSVGRERQGDLRGAMLACRFAAELARSAPEPAPGLMSMLEERMALLDALLGADSRGSS